MTLPLDLDGRVDAVRDAVASSAEGARDDGRVDRALLAELGARGMIGRIFPEEFGGRGPAAASAVELCVLREGAARASTAAETAIALQGLGAFSILQAGSRALAQRWIPAVARGEAVASFALTEPQAGSDPAALELAAEPDGDGWRLSGEKAWISNAPDADVYTVFARTSPASDGRGGRGVTAFVVAGDAPGLTGEPLDLIAPHAVGRLAFDAVPVSRDDVLGEVDAGLRVAMATLDRFRPSVGAFAVGMAQAALDAAIAYTQQRETFGKPLAAHQAVAHDLAEMATRTQAARLLVYDAAARLDAGHRATQAAAMAKLHATETAQWVVDRALQFHGAAGLEEGHLLGHLYREVRAPRIYEGASEIQRTIVARELLG
ncbi:acyl-CoA dehydrogenase [Egibacter rhizosphaerae]|uniref:Acyl-CoA dehydrogenase n=2 Tax=Egibacter rhizosphaerae TaxID=1670831 RepID=A0A411YLC5_9ACTN|nr:acyl-CoA dehydrogenase [Egibacter rhizosphaerae]